MDNNERMFFEAGDDDLGLQVVAFAGGKDVSFSCNDEWCGDTESGFGATVSVILGRDDAEKLRDFLDAWLKTPNVQSNRPARLFAQVRLTAGLGHTSQLTLGERNPPEICALERQTASALPADDHETN